jgi:hypothetical protein
MRLRYCDTLVCKEIGDVIPNDGVWRFITASFTMSDNMNTAGSIQFQPAFTSQNVSSGEYLEFALCQLELGSVATEFEHRSYGEELALCQRYYTLSPYSGERCIINTVHGHTKGTTIYEWYTLHFPVEMRTTPTVSTISGALGNDSITADGKVRFVESPSSSGGTDSSPYNIGAQDNKSISIKTYNEHNSSTWYGIVAGYTADAEL